ncbi:uncharacterized protein LOC132390012 [Hypanus sabinus]|uniref:uncharacterized protein LOC132390012 n=1 Tax=Hypanus sabinus TaxID=79690 RepID=UPI0028C47B4C|nr:uncharacterized protein LOC132390012 [Hypanus sabinus]
MRQVSAERHRHRVEGVVNGECLVPKPTASLIQGMKILSYLQSNRTLSDTRSACCLIHNITSRWRFPEPGPGCEQDDDQQSSVRIRMDKVGKLKRAAIGLKRILSGGSSREDDRDTGSKVPNQGQIKSNVPMESGPAAEEEEQIQPGDSDVSDTDQDPGTSTSEATACQLGSLLNMELSSPQQGAESEFTISDLLAEGEEYRLYQQTKFYRDRLQQAIEEKVERLGIMLSEAGHLSREENESNDLSPSIFSCIINYLNSIIAVCCLKIIRCVIHNSSVNEGAQARIQEVITILQHECQAVTIFIMRQPH